MKRVFTLFSFFFLIGYAMSMAQSQQSVDQLYKKARAAAFDDNDYGQAREYAYSAIKRSPNYHEVRIFVARLYSWDEKYEKAREELGYVLRKISDHRQALSGMIDVENWSGNKQTALQIAERALKYYPEDVEFLLKKGSILYDLESYRGSEQVYKKVLRISSGNQKAHRGLEAARLEQMMYKVNLSYRYDSFTDVFDHWQFWDLGLARKTSYGPIIGRVQYARRLGSNGAQFTVDAYPSITKGLYAYISGGYSQSAIYPKYRLGLSVYKSLPLSLELGVGLQYLSFNNSQTNLYTASLTKYLGSYLFAMQTYFVPSEDNSSRSLSLSARRNFEAKNAYISLKSGFGSLSTNIQFSQDVQTADYRSMVIEGQYPILGRLLLGGSFGYDVSEFQNYTRKRFSSKLFISYRF